MGNNSLTPYQKLKSLGYFVPQSFCIFPAFILNYLAASPTVFKGLKSVQHLFDYHLRKTSYRGYHEILWYNTKRSYYSLGDIPLLKY